MCGDLESLLAVSASQAEQSTTEGREGTINTHWAGCGWQTRDQHSLIVRKYFHIKYYKAYYRENIYSCTFLLFFYCKTVSTIHYSPTYEHYCYTIYIYIFTINIHISVGPPDSTRSGNPSDVYVRYYIRRWYATTTVQCSALLLSYKLVFCLDWNQSFSSKLNFTTNVMRWGWACSSGNAGQRRDELKTLINVWKGWEQ